MFAFLRSLAALFYAQFQVVAPEVIPFAVADGETVTALVCVRGDGVYDLVRLETVAQVPLAYEYEPEAGMFAESDRLGALPPGGM